MRRWLSALLDRIGLWVVRRFNGWRVGDPDRQMYLESAARIGVRVAAVSSALVVGMAVVVAAYIAWKASPAQMHAHHGPRYVHIYLDTRDLTIGVIALGSFSVAMACVATWVIAGRAVRPLGEAFQAQRRFVADASHELRTPLAVLSARVQQLQTQLGNPDRREEIAGQVYADTNVLIDIVNDMLEAAAGRAAEVTEASLVAEADGALRDMAVIAEQHDVNLTCEQLPEVRVHLPPIQLRRAIVALIDNAIDHTPSGGHVTVTAGLLGSRLQLRFTDTGRGITGIDLTHIFDRFAHGEPGGRNPRANSRTGYGIGLALVREIAARAGGSVSVERTGANGTVFLLDLPVVRG
ncbi:sensor histidine kinase [Gryllotalpicola reticulitermitis]|uniref:histidine kinase n=1 Tax=Gryllotalpicola reticulitermitis TaxID=1184153 RepID=A0ABV8Q311_9MICO